MVAFVIELVNAADAVKDEGDVGQTVFQFKITRSGTFDPSKEYRVPVRIPQPQQADAYDFPLLSPLRSDGTAEVVFRGNETEQILTFSVRGDKLVELNEIIRLSISGFQTYDMDGNSLGGGLLSSSAVVVIRNDDLPADHTLGSQHISLAEQRGELQQIIDFYSQPRTPAQLAADAKAAAQKEIDEAKKDGRITPEEKKAIEDAFNGYGFDADLADMIKKAALAVAAEAVDKAVRDGAITAEEKAAVKAATEGLGFDEDVDGLINEAEQSLENASIDGARFFFAAAAPDDGTALIGNAGLDVALIDRSSLDLASTELGEDGTILTFTDGSELVLEEIEYLQFSDLLFEVDSADNLPPFATSDLLVVGATYQFFSGRIPTAGGFEFLIASDDNTTDLNDPYYAPFNQENRFINFANNLGSFGAGKDGFEQRYGVLSFEQTIRTAYAEIIGLDEAAAAGIDAEAAIAFFLSAQPFYQAVALERVVSLEVSLEQAVKVVAIGSILNEAVKAGVGIYAEALNQWLIDLLADNESAYLGESVLGIEAAEAVRNTEAAVLQLYQFMTGETPDQAGFDAAVNEIAAISAQSGVETGWTSIGASLASSGTAALFAHRFEGLDGDEFIALVTTEIFGQEIVNGDLQSSLDAYLAAFAQLPIEADPDGTIRAKGAFIAELLFQASQSGEGPYFLAANAFLSGLAAGVNVLGQPLFDIDFFDAPDGTSDTLAGLPGQNNILSGDAGQMVGTAIGGNDTLTGADNAENTLYGDDAVLRGYSQGGDDIITAGFDSINNLYGDGLTLDDRAWGGNDTITGAPGGQATVNFLVGDAETMGENTRGGNDTITGGPDMAPNFLFGDAIYVSVVQSGAPDYLVAQPKCGDDTIISGAASNDTMVGDAQFSVITLSDGRVTTVNGVGSAVMGRDVFVFAPGNGLDVVLDFQSGKDKIDLSGFGSGLDFSKLLISDIGGTGNLTIPFDENNSITLVGISSVSAEDFIFAT